MRAPRSGWVFIIVAPLLLTCLVTLASMGRPGMPAFPALHESEKVAWIVWAALSAAVIAVVRRFPFGAGSSMTWLLRHFAVGTTFSVVAVALERLLHHGGHAGGAVQPPVIASVATGLLIYTLIAVSYQAIAYRLEARSRAADATRLRADLAEARLSALESKLQPHFLFNALNSTAALVKKDPAAAEEMLEQLSELLRASLQTNPMAEVPFAEALRLAEQYLAIERVRYGERLRIQLDVEPAALQCKLPQLVLQPLVENAVRHGIAPVPGGGKITLTAGVRDSRLHVTVEDDGIGYGASTIGAGGGIGLTGVRSALAHVYGARQRFHIGPRQPRGTVASMELPCDAVKG